MPNYHEQAFILAKGHPAKPPKPLRSVRKWTYSGNKLHPTEKAPEILKPLITSYSAKGDTVLDPFSGSGSTAFAAKELGRSYIGIELDPQHVATARKRLT